MKRVLSTLAILFFLVASIFADPSLLTRSVLSCNHQELVAFAQAYGLDAGLSDDELRTALLDILGLSSAEDPEPETYSGKVSSAISINNADTMVSNDSFVVLTGNVRLSFSLEDGSDCELEASKVVADAQARLLQAYGDVFLEDSSKQRSFTGQGLSLNWESMDVKVVDGKTSTEKRTTEGLEVSFHVSGDSIAYDGDASVSLIRNGVISTTDSEPYWSIKAKRIALSGQDIFIDNAVLDLGRVPVLYLPVFFFPGTRLSFNPAMGLDSSKGAFLSTTTEIYGSYPKLNGQVASSEDSAPVASILSMVGSGDESEMVRDGLYYRPLQEGEDLGNLQNWARSTNSYLAVFADTYDKLGTLLGYDTSNRFASGAVTLDSLGAIAYKAEPVSINVPKLRYTLDFSFRYNRNNLNVTAKLPVFSDPYVRQDYLNRNTVFGIDSVFGAQQSFPSSYASQNSYAWTLNASWSKKIGNYSFNLNSLKVNADYRLNKVVGPEGVLYEPEMTAASLPYLSFGSSGTFFEFRGSDNIRKNEVGYSNMTAAEMAMVLETLEIPDNGSSIVVEGMVPYSGPHVDLVSTTTLKGPGVKAGYTFNQTLDNRFNGSIQDSFYTRMNGTVYLSADAPASLLSVKETLKPTFSFTSKDISKTTASDSVEFSLDSAFEASIPLVGLTYSLNQKLYRSFSKRTLLDQEETQTFGTWNRGDVTAHNLRFSRKSGSLVYGVFFQLKPLVEIIRPSLSLRLGSYTTDADFSLERDSDSFHKGQGNLNASYDDGTFLFSLANRYDFTKVSSSSDAWKGYSLVQKAKLSFQEFFTISQSMDFRGCFEIESLKAGMTFNHVSDIMSLKANSTIQFLGPELEKDSLTVDLSFATDELRFWKGRMAFRTSEAFSLTYDFGNPFRSSLDFSFGLEYSVAEFLDLALSLKSRNKSFIRYYEGGVFSFGSMMKDLARSFDIFGAGSRNTGFNLDSFRLSLVHYMRDWNLYIDAEGKLTTQYSGKYEWVPSVTVCIKWNILPELKTEGSWNANSKEWK